MSSRPEHVAPADVFYNLEEAKKYASNSRMMTIQTRMTERAVELLALSPGQKHILDIGCGSGLSGNVLSELGHTWVGVDISPSMLGVAVERECEGDLICADMGDGLFFRPGSFDGCISISALQWLCNADARHHVPHKRLKVFFQSLYNSLAAGARAVFQFYPETPQQVTMITTAAMRCGFSGGLVVDYPNSTKAKKYFLCLFAGEASKDNYNPVGRSHADDLAADNMEEDGEEGEVKNAQETVVFAKKEASMKRRHLHKISKMKNRKKAPVKSREWVLKKKDRARALGKTVANNSKYTARRRRAGF